MLRLHSGVNSPLEELKRLNKELTEVQAQAMTAAPDRSGGVANALGSEGPEGQAGEALHRNEQERHHDEQLPQSSKVRVLKICFKLGVSSDFGSHR